MAKTVDIADQLWRELGAPSFVSIPSIAFWLQTNIGKLNTRINRKFQLSPALEIVEIIDDISYLIDEDAVSIYKKMYSLHYYDLEIRRNIGAAGAEPIVEIVNDGKSVRKVSKTEIGKNLYNIRKLESEELEKMITGYKLHRANPRQVAGDDTIQGTNNLKGYIQGVL